MNALAFLLDLTVVVSSALLLLLSARASRRRSAGRNPWVHDLQEAAFLGGGPARVVDTALTALYADGRMVIGGPGIVAVRRAEARDAVERAVLQELAAAPSGALHTLRESVMRHPAVQEIGDGLAARGLLTAPGKNRARRRWALVLGIGCVVAIPVSIAATVAQYALHEGYADVPFPFFVKVLPFLVAGAAVGLTTASAARARLTEAGRLAAHQHRATHAHASDPAHFVAARGPGAAPFPELRDHLLAAARHRSPRHGGRTTSVGAGGAAAWCAG
ncbi:TIGR04222 domain-containing membrane protein, partial [Streptomyces sp. NRRL WC-3549]|uniref:TIGR04222 domain-containing membrane protein n=1 Tax=Streptomyces sp. NRRL WC-3549 TaxID=1463925 RepID=UPI0004C7E32B